MTLFQRKEKGCDSTLFFEQSLIPPLCKELNEATKGLIQEGFSRRLIKKVFETAYKDMVVKQIKEYAISMKGLDMKDVLTTYYATQISTKLFESFQKHIANIVVGAVYSTGYHYKDIGPFEASINDFEDGFDMIKINKVSGGSVGDSFFVQGIAFKQRAHGFEKLEQVKNPSIMLLKIMNGDDINLIDILDNHVERQPNIILSGQAIDGDTKKILADRCVYYADLVSEDELVRVAEATCAISLNLDCFPHILIGSCKHFQQKKFGEEVFGIFSGSPRGKTATIVLHGDDQFIEEASDYIYSLIPDVRTVMKGYTLVAGGRALYDRLIRYVLEEANNGDKDSKRIIEAYAKAIQTVLEKTHYNVGCKEVNNPSQKHAVALGEGDTLWEPPSLKISIIGFATRQACFYLNEIK